MAPGHIEVSASPSRAAHLVKTELKDALSGVEWEEAHVLTPIGAWTLTVQGKKDNTEFTLRVVLTYHPLVDDQEHALDRVANALGIRRILERR